MSLGSVDLQSVRVNSGGPGFESPIQIKKVSSSQSKVWKGTQYISIAKNGNLINTLCEEQENQALRIIRSGPKSSNLKRLLNKKITAFDGIKKSLRSFEKVTD